MAPPSPPSTGAAPRQAIVARSPRSRWRRWAGVFDKDPVEFASTASLRQAACGHRQSLEPKPEPGNQRLEQSDGASARFPGPVSYALRPRGTGAREGCEAGVAAPSVRGR